MNSVSLSLSLFLSLSPQTFEQFQQQQISILEWFLNDHGKSQNIYLKNCYFEL